MTTLLDVQQRPPREREFNDLRFEVDSASAEEWYQHLALFDDASLYQTLAYGSVCWGRNNLSHIVLKQGTRVLSVAQVRIIKIPFLRNGIAYVRWGPLWRLKAEVVNGRILEEMLFALKKEYADRRGLLLRIVPNIFTDEPYDLEWNRASRLAGFVSDPSVHTYCTMRVDLNRTFEAIRAGLRSRWRNYLKSAEKNDYKVTQGSDPQLYETFLRLYSEMMERKHFETTVDVKEFARIHESLPDNWKFHVLVCEKSGEALNALVVSVIGNSPIYLLAATGHRGLNDRGAHLLQWRAMENLHQRGCQWYDLGGINPNLNPGVFQFKSGLGGHEARNLGGFEIGGSWANSILVKGAEGLRSGLHTIKRRFR